MKKLMLSLSAMTSLMACTQKAADEGKSNKRPSAPLSGQPPGEKPVSPSDNRPIQPGDDAIAIPVNIAGAHLTCAVRKEATDKSLESEIGCLLSEKEGGKKLASDAKLSFSSSQPNLVTAELQSETSIYHVIYHVKGESRDAILQTTQSLDAIALYSAKPFITERIAKVLKPAIALDDYEAPIVRDQAIDKDEDGSL
ncbi:MAG: hypothetical protein V4655_14415 [Bdellovibrionota bacterium]|nr:MAG: hypothetical protein EOP10_28335 [Pseudomonadota bacterium]